jgi:hypothetical protein
MGRILLLPLALVALGSPGWAAAQARTAPPFDNDFGIAVSVTRYALKDEVLNPLRHSGTFVSLGFFYERPRPRSASRFDLDLVFNPVSSRYESGKDSFASALRLAYRRVRQVARPGAELRLLAGGAVAFTNQFAYFDNWDDSHGYWLTAYSIDATGTLEYTAWVGRPVSLEVTVPLLALVSRPRSPILYKSDSTDFGWIVRKLHERMTLTSLHRHRAVEATLRLSMTGATWGRSFFWHVAYVHNDLPHSSPVEALRHSVGATVVF